MLGPDNLDVLVQGRHQGLLPVKIPHQNPHKLLPPFRFVADFSRAFLLLLLFSHGGAGTRPPLKAEASVGGSTGPSAGGAAAQPGGREGRKGEVLGRRREAVWDSQEEEHSRPESMNPVFESRRRRTKGTGSRGLGSVGFVKYPFILFLVRTA